MIYTECTITVKNNKSSIDNDILLYRGDKEVQIYFTIVNSKYKYSNVATINLIENTNASYGQLIIKRPESTPIFTEIVPTSNGRVLLTITSDMIDEIEEVGSYDFQIRLFDQEKTSRITIPPVIGGIVIEEPIAIEDVSTINKVNLATVNNAVITTEEALNVFDEDGNYIKTTWLDKDVITDSKLNKIEDGIEGVNQKIDSVSTSIPTATSDLTNDIGFITADNIPITIDSTDQPQTTKPVEVIPAGITVTTYNPNAKLVIKNASGNSTQYISHLGTTTLDVNLDDATELTFTDVEKVTVKDVPNIQKITATCSELNVSGIDELRRINIKGDICNNTEAMIKLAEGLRDRNDMAWGSVVTQNQDVRREVEDHFIQKDWYFGTDTVVSSANCPHFKTMSICDIWESAEYGEGRTYAVADTEIDDGGEGCTNPLLNEFNNTDIPASNYLGKFSFCTSEPNFLGGTQNNHGLSVLSVIAMDGNNKFSAYGVAPKSQFYMFKIANKEGSSNKNDWYPVITKATELNLDGLNISYGTASNTTVDQTIADTDKNICIAFADNKGILCCANGNEGTNVINEDGTVTSVHEGVQYPQNGSFSIATGSTRKNETISDFSTCCDGLDFMAVSGNTNPSEYAVIGRFKKNTTGEVVYSMYNGTSYSSPLILGCVLLMKNLFYKKYKREATQRELVEYMSKHTRDMGLEAYQQGYGIFDFMAYNPNPKQVTKKI